jgi:hypothetical protein
MMTGYEVPSCGRTNKSSMPREMGLLSGDHDQVISLPICEGRYNFGANFDWELKSTIFLDAIILLNMRK